MPYIYRVSRRDRTTTTVTPEAASPSKAGVTVAKVSIEPASAPEPPQPPYRALQAQAKALDIPGNQKSGKLKKAIAEAKRNG